MLLKRYRHPHRRLIFPPGFLALSLFVFVASLCVLKHEQMRPLNVIEVSYPFENSRYTIYCGSPLKSPKQTLTISNNWVLFMAQQKQIDTLLINCRSRLDTNLSLQFKFNDSLPWQHFIALLDLLKRNDFRRYMITDSSICVLTDTKESYIEPEKKNVKRTYIECGLQYLPDPIATFQYEQKQMEIQKRINKAAMIVVLPLFYTHFLLLLVFGIISFWKLRYRRD